MHSDFTAEAELKYFNQEPNQHNLVQLIKIPPTPLSSLELPNNTLKQNLKTLHIINSSQSSESNLVFFLKSKQH